MFCRRCWTNLPDGTQRCPRCKAPPHLIPLTKNVTPVANEPPPAPEKRAGRGALLGLGLLVLVLAALIAHRLLIRSPFSATGSRSVPAGESTAPPELQIVVPPPSAGSVPIEMGAKNSQVRELLDRAVAAYEEERYEQAIQLFESARAVEPADPEIRKALASSYGLLGWEQVASGKYESAIKAFEQGLAASQDEALSYTGIGYVYYQLRRDEEAIPPLRRAIALDPRDARALQLLGEIHYRRDEFSEATGFFQKALELDPHDLALREKLDKIRREQENQAGFVRAATRHFTLQFDGAENRDLYRVVLETLEEAYGDVGRALSFYPAEEVTVVLYTGKQFQDVTRMPSWAGAAYDGKIRLPSAGYEREPRLLKKVLYHEYTHAVIHAITRQQIAGIEGLPAPRVPVWLHEGLAQYLEIDSERNTIKPSLQRLAQRDVFIPLTYLEGSFAALNSAQAALAYAESLSAVAYLVDRYGMYRVKQLLEALGGHQELEAAFREAFSTSYEDVQKSWHASLLEG